MYEYDCVVMRDPGDGFDCIENSVIETTLSEEEDREMIDKGFLIKEISATEYHIIVNRMDVDNLQKASDEFWKDK